MPATRLSRNDSGQLIDALKDLSVLLENLGVEDGNVVLSLIHISEPTRPY